MKNQSKAQPAGWHVPLFAGRWDRAVGALEYRGWEGYRGKEGKDGKQEFYEGWKQERNAECYFLLFNFALEYFQKHYSPKCYLTLAG